MTQAWSRCLPVTLSTREPTFHSLSLCGLRKRDGARKKGCLVSVGQIANQQKRVDVGTEMARRPVISPDPKLALQMLLCSQLYLLETYTNNYPHSIAQVTTSHSLNIFDLIPPIIPFPNWITQRIKQNPHGHEFERFRLPSETPSAEVKGDSWTRSMWEGKSQPHHKGNRTLLNWKTKT